MILWQGFFFIFFYHFLDKIDPALQPVRPQLHPWTQLRYISYFSYVSYLKHAFCMIFMSLTYVENANWRGQSGMCGDFVQILDCALWGWTGLVFFFHYGCWFHWWNLSKLLIHRTEQAFFLCYVVGCAVFPLETNLQWSCKNKSKPQHCFGDLMCKRKVYYQLNRALIFLFWPSLVSVHMSVCCG